MQMIPLPLTTLYTAFMGITVVILGMRVTHLRRQYNVDLDSRGNIELLKAIRVHGNFAEYVPLAIILLGLTEMNGMDHLLVHFFGLTLVIGRILHVHGLYRTTGVSLGRSIGIGVTWAVMFVLSCIAVQQVYTAYHPIPS